MVDARTELARLSDELFALQHGTDPFSATMLGVGGFDHRVPDPSRAAARTAAAGFAALEQQADALDTAGLTEDERTNAAVLARLAWGARSDLEHGLWEAGASAAAYANPQALLFQAVPSAPLPDRVAVASYLTRLTRLGGYLDAIGARYREAARDGRTSTQVGVAQALDQLHGHLALAPEQDTLLTVALPADVDAVTVRAQAAVVLAEQVRPALQRLSAVLQDVVAPNARDDEHVGIRYVPGGEQGYRAAVRRHTTTELDPAEIHEIGRQCLRELADEWAEIGGRALGTTDVVEIRRRLREDPSLRFTDTRQIVGVVTGALARAEAVRDAWFPPYDIAPCVVEEIDPLEAGNAPMAYYRPPAGDGSRPGAHCVLTADPGARFTYEYEALAFHESTPGHHLQIASAQRRPGLPAYRRFLDAEVCGYVEGWGLYCERLADEMGLYTSDLARLGMLSFDALRACRLVVDTGMHLHGWSRQRAMAFLWENTATTRSNVANETSRYISWPGQALAYMIGRREIVRLRGDAEQALGSSFDVRAFHGVVLGQGAVPLDVLARNVSRWVAAAQD